MIFRLANDTRNAIANCLRDRIDEAGEGGGLMFYAAPQPANAKVPVTDQKFFGKATFSFPSAADAIDGILSFAAIAEVKDALESGEVAWARAVDAAGEVVFDCDVTGPKGGGMIEINTTSITSGGPLRVRSLTIVVPAG